MQDLREKLEIFESLMASMTDIAATVPWKESTEQESTEASLETIRNDARRKQQELHETISFHKQYREAVVNASDCLGEIEEKLVDKESHDNGLQNRPFYEVSAVVFWKHAPGKYRYYFPSRVPSIPLNDLILLMYTLRSSGVCWRRFSYGS